MVPILPGCSMIACHKVPIQPLNFLVSIATTARSPLADAFAEFVLGLEIVVNIPYRDMGGFGDDREAGLPETTPVGKFHSGLNQPFPFVYLCLRHIVVS